MCRIAWIKLYGTRAYDRQVIINWKNNNIQHTWYLWSRSENRWYKQCTTLHLSKDGRKNKDQLYTKTAYTVMRQKGHTLGGNAIKSGFKSHRMNRMNEELRGRLSWATEDDFIQSWRKYKGPIACTIYYIRRMIWEDSHKKKMHKEWLNCSKCKNVLPHVLFFFFPISSCSWMDHEKKKQEKTETKSTKHPKPQTYMTAHFHSSKFYI